MPLHNAAQPVMTKAKRTTMEKSAGKGGEKLLEASSSTQPVVINHLVHAVWEACHGQKGYLHSQQAGLTAECSGAEGWVLLAAQVCPVPDPWRISVSHVATALQSADV